MLRLFQLVQRAAKADLSRFINAVSVERTHQTDRDALEHLTPCALILHVAVLSSHVINLMVHTEGLGSVRRRADPYSLTRSLSRAIRGAPAGGA